MTLRTRLGAVAPLGLLALASACSASGEPGRSGRADDPTDVGSAGGSSPNAGAGDAISMAGKVAVIAANGGTPASSGGKEDPPGCAEATQEAELTPIYLAFVYDKSGSMGDDPNGLWKNLNLRWNPMKQGMGDFFTNARVTGVQASLVFFPAAGDKAGTCGANYAAPMVPMTPLIQPAALVAALEATSPSGGTPTLPAVMGGLSYLSGIVARNPSAKASLVLVTDGEPAIYNSDTGQIETDCAPTGSALTNTIADISTVVAAAHAATPPVSTYVIGVGTGNSLASLASIAAAGGTELILIDPVDAAQTRARITAELEAIRVRQFSCEMPVPNPPAGRTLSYGHVNVEFSHSSGNTTQFVRSDQCQTAGWHYDATPPTRIVLCPEACELVQADTTGQIQVVLGCATVVE